MIKKLRAKFVLVFMVTVAALLLTIFCLICNTTRKEMRAASLAALQSAVFDPEKPLNNEELPDIGKHDDMPGIEQDGKKPGPMGSSPCFVLWLTPQQCKEIFKRFYRVDGSRSMARSYGLGLPIAEGIITRHKGKIWCQSKDGINTFYVSLPTCNHKH